MNGASTAVVAVSASLFTILGVAWQIWQGVRQRAAAEIRDRAEQIGKAFSDGVKSRDDEVRQLTYERESAREQWKREQARADDYERRWNELRDRRRRAD